MGAERKRFEDATPPALEMGEGGREPNDAGGFWKLEKSGKWNFQKECSPADPF